jgi:hypothetical protein
MSSTFASYLTKIKLQGIAYWRIKELYNGLKGNIAVEYSVINVFMFLRNLKILPKVEHNLWNK